MLTNCPGKFWWTNRMRTLSSKRAARTHQLACQELGEDSASAASERQQLRERRGRASAAHLGSERTPAEVRACQGARGLGRCHLLPPTGARELERKRRARASRRRTP